MNVYGQTFKLSHAASAINLTGQFADRRPQTKLNPAIYRIHPFSAAWKQQCFVNIKTAIPFILVNILNIINFKSKDR